MVFGLPPSVKIYFARDLVDMRNGIDGLRAMVEGALKKDPYEGHPQRRLDELLPGAWAKAQA